MIVGLLHMQSIEKIIKLSKIFGFDIIQNIYNNLKFCNQNWFLFSDFHVRLILLFYILKYLNLMDANLALNLIY